MNAFQSETYDDTESKSPVGNIVFGRFMLPDMSEHPCQVRDVDSDGAVFISATIPPAGQAIVAYIEELGRVEAVSGEPVTGGFAIAFSATGARRDRLISKIEWMKKREIGGSENRRYPRYEPREKASQITLPDGRVYPVEVIDISVSGAAFKSDVMPGLGTLMLLGRMKGKVVRYLETGVAIEFVKPMDKSNLQQQIGTS